MKTMIFNETEINRIIKLSDALMQILIKDFGYTFSANFERKVHYFIVDQYWKAKEKEDGKIFTEKEYKLFALALFYLLFLDEKSFLKEFENFSL